MSRIPIIDKAILEKLATEDITQGEIAKRYHTTQSVVSHSMKRYGIKARRTGRPYVSNEEKVIIPIGNEGLDSIKENPFKKYLITSIQKETQPNKEVLKVFEQYCDANNVELILIVLKAKHTHDDEQIHPFFKDYKMLDRDVKLNDSIMVKNANILPQQIIPLTGLNRFVSKDGSTVVGATKQQMTNIGTPVGKYPKMVMTTGALTLPNYKDNRIGKIALQDHNYGAVFVDVKDHTIYVSRIIRSLVNGSMTDMCNQYTIDGNIITVRPEAMILGDWHVGDTDPVVKEKTFELIQKYKPRRIFLHDFFNGHSITHHESNKPLNKAITYKEQTLTLEEELMACSEELKYFVDNTPEDCEINIVKGNHDEFLDRYLKEMRYKDDPNNIETALELSLAYIKKQNVLEHGLEKFNDFRKKVKFIERNQTYKLLGWELGMHGDLGLNGAKASEKSSEDAFRAIIKGHTHNSKIFRSVVGVGTSTKLELKYNKGLSNWTHAHSFVYPNGTQQLIHIINGTYE